MLQIKQNSSNNLEITDRKTTVVLDEQNIAVNEQKLASPGEYESGGIEVVYGETGALIIWERIQFIYQFSPKAPSSFDKSQFSSADVLIVSSAIGTVEKDVFGEWAESYDPVIVIAPSSVKLTEIVPAAAKIEETTLVKLAEQALPTEGREYYQLG